MTDVTVKEFAKMMGIPEDRLKMMGIPEDRLKTILASLQKAGVTVTSPNQPLTAEQKRALLTVLKKCPR